jgi:2-(1,2-epoxy-1,2-dihydrophenyl)acetyl-CoA isomerase
MTFSTIEFDCADGVANLTLNRPDRLNSFNTMMHSEVREALDRVRDDDAVRCLLLTGRGRGFCAGQDLSDRRASADGTPPDLTASIRDNYNPLITRLTELPKPVVCAVNGVAAGAGANIALACDIVLAARSASFIQSFSKIGLIPDSGGTWWLAHLVGRARALGLAMTGERLRAEQAEQWGLIWKCVDDDLLADTARTLARNLATQPTLGLGLTKQAVNAAFSNDLPTQLDLEARIQGEAGRSLDYREGVAAFIEKREPRFVGR